MGGPELHSGFDFTTSGGADQVCDFARQYVSDTESCGPLRRQCHVTRAHTQAQRISDRRTFGQWNRERIAVEINGREMKPRVVAQNSSFDEHPSLKATRYRFKVKTFENLRRPAVHLNLPFGKHHHSIREAGHFIKVVAHEERRNHKAPGHVF